MLCQCIILDDDTHVVSVHVVQSGVSCTRWCAGGFSAAGTPCTMHTIRAARFPPEYSKDLTPCSIVVALQMVVLYYCAHEFVVSIRPLESSRSGIRGTRVRTKRSVNRVK